MSGRAAGPRRRTAVDGDDRTGASAAPHGSGAPWRGPGQPLTAASVAHIQRQAGNKATGAAVDDWDTNMKKFDQTMADLRKETEHTRRIANEMQYTAESSTVFLMWWSQQKPVPEVVDEIFYMRHEEMRGKKLDPKNPRHKRLMREWGNIHVFVKKEIPKIEAKYGKRGE